MLRVSIAIALGASLLVGCSAFSPSSADKTDANSTTSTYWVNSLNAKCVGVGPMQCLQVQKGEELSAGNWQLFYAPIHGFEYVPGYIYKLKVKETQLPAHQVPADKSSIAYELVEVLDKQADSRLRLHDIWVLEAIEGEPLALTSERQRPRLEFNLTEMRFTGTDGCNNVFGNLHAVTPDTLSLGPIAATMMACADMATADRFWQRLGKVEGYLLEGLKLHLQNASGKTLLSFQKTD